MGHMGVSDIRGGTSLGSSLQGNLSFSGSIVGVTYLRKLSYRASGLGFAVRVAGT